MIIRMSILEDHMTPIKQPPEITNKYWEIIEPMIRWNPTERLSPQEVCVCIFACI
jgi:hypothetical protein